MPKNKIVNADTATAALHYVQHLDQLTKKATQFETVELVRTNKALYDILAEIYEQYKCAAVDKDVLNATVINLKNVLAQNNVRIQKNMSALSLFVRHVFKIERQRIHQYTRAIKAAISSGIAPNKFADFIVDAGGIDQCGKKATVSAVAVTTRTKINEAILSVTDRISNTNNPIASFDVQPNLVANSYQQPFTLLIAKADKFGHIDVINIVPRTSRALENAVKSILAQHQLAQNDQHIKAQAIDDERTAIAAVVAAVDNTNTDNSSNTASNVIAQ